MSDTPPPDADRLLFAIPKKGRLFERVNKLLLGAGLDYHRVARLDVAECTGLPVTLVFLPAHDIGSYVAEGNVDLGITGRDVVAETQSSVEEITALGFGKCKLCLLAPTKMRATGPEQLSGQRIVTSFPHLSKTYFEEFDSADKPTSVRFVSGSVEAACGLGLADGVIDLVETGTTMKAAGLEIVSTVLETQAVLIGNPKSKHQELKKTIEKRILGFMTAEKHKMITYNISRDKLPEAELITPGKKSPTVTPLENPDYVSVSAVIPSKETATIMDRLVEVGATGILLFDISNSRM